MQVLHSGLEFEKKMALFLNQILIAYGDGSGYPKPGFLEVVLLRNGIKGKFNKTFLHFWPNYWHI